MALPLLAAAAIAAPAAGSMVTGILNYLETRRANKENLALAHITRQDTLAAQRADIRQSNKTLALNTRQQDFNEQDTLYQRGVAEEQKTYNRSKDQYAAALQTLSTKAGLVRNKTAPLIK